MTGEQVKPPIPNAMISVTLVTVMAAPACFMVTPNLSMRLRDFSSGFKVSQLCTMTNISSIPIPSIRKGITEKGRDAKKVLTNIPHISKSIKNRSKSLEKFLDFILLLFIPP